MTPEPDPPKLAAEFVLDAEGRPKFFLSGEKKHWQILLKLVNAPTDAASVTYKLHETYWDPLREVLRPRGLPPGEPLTFPEKISSYGDFKVKASVSGSPLAGQRIEGQLSDLLEASLPPPGFGLRPDSLPSPSVDEAAIRQAIEELREQ